jgi:mono/diheme cytochrome c family protein
MLRMMAQCRAAWAVLTIALVVMILLWSGCAVSEFGGRGVEPPAEDQSIRGAAVAGTTGHGGHGEMGGKSHIHAPVPPEYGGKAPPAGIWTNPTVLAQGQALYRRDCLACHGEQGDGRGPAAADLPLKPPDFRDRSMVRAMAPDYWLWRVMEGGQGVEPYRSMGSTMPPWKGQLSEDEAWAVIAYAHTFSRPHTPHTSKGHH